MRALTHRRAAAIGFALALLLGASGCGDDSGGGAAEKLDIGLTFGLDAASTADKIAFERVEDELGAEIEIIETGDPAATVAGLTRGDLDFGQFPIRSVIEAVQQGAELHAVIGSQMVPDYFVVAGAGIEEPADLRGARLAHHGPGTDTEALAMLTLEQAGLSDDEVALTALAESPNRATALANGRIDAAVLESVDVQRLREDGFELNIVSEMRDYWPGSASGGWAVSDELIEDDPELVGDVVEIMLDTYESLYSGDGRAEWLEQTGAEALVGESERTREALLAHLLEIGMWPRRDEPVSKQSYDAAVEFWLQNDLLEEGLPFDRVWDTSFWQSAADAER